MSEESLCHKRICHIIIDVQILHLFKEFLSMLRSFHLYPQLSGSFFRQLLNGPWSEVSSKDSFPRSREQLWHFKVPGSSSSLLSSFSHQTGSAISTSSEHFDKKLIGSDPKNYKNSRFSLTWSLNLKCVSHIVQIVVYYAMFCSKLMETWAGLLDRAAVPRTRARRMKKHPLCVWRQPLPEWVQLWVCPLMLQVTDV